MSFFETYGQPQTTDELQAQGFIMSKIYPELDINNYVSDGFVKVCTAVHAPYLRWTYTIHDKSAMFDTHTSWVYFIVVSNEIVKVGETGMPLGIKQGDGQPLSKSNNRFGRYRCGSETDAYIRESLHTEVKQGKVSLWARKCPVAQTTIQVAGVARTVQAAFHKELELQYLDYMYEQGSWPRLNKLRK